MNAAISRALLFVAFIIMGHVLLFACPESTGSAKVTWCGWGLQ